MLAKNIIGINVSVEMEDAFGERYSFSNVNFEPNIIFTSAMGKMSCGKGFCDDE